MQIIIPGKPIPKIRHRNARYGGMYDPKAKEKHACQIMIKCQWKGEPLEGPVSLEIIFYMPIPKMSKKKQLATIARPHTKKPDKDNLEKFILDCMNGIVFKDDSQVWDSRSRKIYSGNPRTEITVKGKLINEVV